MKNPESKIGTRRRALLEIQAIMEETLISEGARKERKKVAIETRQQTLVRLLQKRFGDVPSWVVDGIYSTHGIRQLDIWLDRFALACRLDKRTLRPAGAEAPCAGPGRR